MVEKDSKKDELILDTLLPDIENMTREETNELFEATGVDLHTLRERLRGAAKEIASNLRKSGTAAPRYLARAIEALDSSATLPSEPAAAAAKALDVIRAYRKPQTVPGDARLLKAARVSPQGSGEDDRAVDELVDDLRREIQGSDDDAKK